MIEQTHSPHAERFIERLGQLAEGENLPRTAGRLMALLILSGTPLGIDEIAKRLHVSRASVSTNSRLLQTLGIAQLARQPGNRRDYLQISGDPSSSLLALGLLRMQSMRSVIREMRLALKSVQPAVSRTRLQRMERFYDTAITQVEAVLARGQSQTAGGRASTSVEVVAASRANEIERSSKAQRTASKRR